MSVAWSPIGTNNSLLTVTELGRVIVWSQTPVEPLSSQGTEQPQLRIQQAWYPNILATATPTEADIYTAPPADPPSSVAGLTSAASLVDGGQTFSIDDFLADPSAGKCPRAPSSRSAVATCWAWVAWYGNIQ